MLNLNDIQKLAVNRSVVFSSLKLLYFLYLEDGKYLPPSYQKSSLTRNGDICDYFWKTNAECDTKLRSATFKCVKYLNLYVDHSSVGF